MPDHSALKAISTSLDSLARSLTLTTGQGQAQVWSLFRQGAHDVSLDASLLDRLSLLDDHKLRASVVDAIVSAQQDPTNIESLTEMLQSLVTMVSPTASLPKTWANGPVLGALELESLRYPETHDASELLVSSREVPLPEVALLRMTRTPATHLRAISAFMSRLWKEINFDTPGQSSEGSAVLFKPVRLASILRYNSSEPVKLADLPEEQQSFKFTVDMVLRNTKQPIVIRSSLEDIATQVLRLLARAFGVLSPTDGGLTGLLETLKLARIPSVALQGLEMKDIDLASIGRFWLGLSRVLIELYVTNIPIDPAVRRVLLGDVLSAQLADLEQELHAIEHGERLTKGISDSHRVSSLKDRLEAVSTEKGTLGPSIDRSTDAGRLATLFSEVHSFMDDAFSASSLESLGQSLHSGHPQALERERGLQISSVAFIQRLHSNYSDLQDLVAPVITAVEFGRFGMRTLARDLELRIASPSASVVDATRFPACVVDVKPASASSMPTNKADLRDLFLSAIALTTPEISGTTRGTELQLIDSLGSLYQAWSDIRQREQQDEQASESLYRVKKTDIEVLSDQELEEQEFAKLFPTYDEDEDGEAPVEEVEKAEVDDKLKFDSDAMITFHHLVMSASNSTTGISYQTATDKLLRTDFVPAAHDEKIDEQSLPLQIRYLYQRLQSLQPATSHPNFYIEANEPEVRKAHGLILRLIARLDRLIEDWPDQVVPQHIKDRCLAVLTLHTRSPVAKVLNSLEQLLLHTNDWEGYANKENSLAAHQAELSALIVEWRRLELSSWMRLLDDQIKEYVNNDAEWTLRLFGALIPGVASVEDVGKHLEETLPMITTYLSTSSLGHFGGRIDVLKSLGQICSRLPGSAYAQVSTLLHNIVQNASLFLPRLLDSLRQQRAVIDKNIKDFVKLASWKDVNVYALKASAVKSHRQLHRAVRKFREVLRQRVAPILMDHNSICPQDPPVPTLPNPASTVFPLFTFDQHLVSAREQVQPSAPAHLVRLEDTMKRYHSVHEQVRSHLSPVVGETLDNMSIDIIETAASLAKATPASLTKENAKLVNNLASRKRKAYSDLLKALRASGFSNSVRADQLGKQQNPKWISSLLPLPEPPTGLELSDVAKIENYHHRLNVLMITLRAAFNGHNPDIASQDLERGIGFAESVFASALVEKQK